MHLIWSKRSSRWFICRSNTAKSYNGNQEGRQRMKKFIKAFLNRLGKMPKVETQPVCDKTMAQKVFPTLFLGVCWQMKFNCTPIKKSPFLEDNLGNAEMVSLRQMRHAESTAFYSNPLLSTCIQCIVVSCYHWGSSSYSCCLLFAFTRIVLQSEEMWFYVQSRERYWIVGTVCMFRLSIPQLSHFKKRM